MSGGSRDYLYCRVKSTFVGSMYDPEIDDLMKDIVELLHDVEWYDSADIGEEDYRETVKKFKRKWFEKPRDYRLKEYVNTAVDRLREELMQMIDGD